MSVGIPCDGKADAEKLKELVDGVSSVDCEGRQGCGPHAV